MTQLQKQQNSVGITVPNTTSKDLLIYNASLSAKKARDFSTKEDLLLVTSMFTRWANYIGVPIPEPADLNTLSNFLRENFPTLNIEDLKECINLLASCKLNTDAEAYGKLSPMYVSKVLKAYQLHKSEVLHKVRNEIQKLESQKTVQVSDSERVKNYQDILKIAKSDVNKNLFYFDAGNVLYDFIIRNKLIVTTIELKREAIEYGKSIYGKESKANSMKAVINNMKFASLDKDAIILKNAKNFIVNTWLRTADVEAVSKSITIQMIKSKRIDGV